MRLSNVPGKATAVMAALVGMTLIASAQEATKPVPPAGGLEETVRQYILDHPEVLIESLKQYKQRAAAAQRQETRDKVAAHRKELLDDGGAISGLSGGEEPVTIVEFFDYRCGYCKKVQDLVAKMAGTPGVRIVYKEFPILGPESVEAARAALAAAKQGAYARFHERLMNLSGPVTADMVARIAGELKLDVQRLEKDSKSPEVEQAIQRNQQLGLALGVQSTPTFVIGKELVAGALSEESLQALIEAARKDSQSTAPATTGGF